RSFTLMHELAHLYLGQSALSDVHFHSSNAQESWCNRVAAELLVPLGDFKNRCDQNQIKEESHIAELARYYNVSELVILIRTYDLKYWNEIDFRKHFQAKSEELKKLAIEIKEKNKKAGGGGDYYKTKLVATSKIFARAVTESAKNHQTLYRDAMDLLAVKKTATFEKLYLCLHGE
nr:ImmA/IrrE family metallo-endopeptidase [Gammaproteobacteria bacterium]